MPHLLSLSLSLSPFYFCGVFVKMLKMLCVCCWTSSLFPYYHLYEKSNTLASYIQILLLHHFIFIIFISCGNLSLPSFFFVCFEKKNEKKNDRSIDRSMMKKKTHISMMKLFDERKKKKNSNNIEDDKKKRKTHTHDDDDAHTTL